VREMAYREVAMWEILNVLIKRADEQATLFLNHSFRLTNATEEEMEMDGRTLLEQLPAATHGSSASTRSISSTTIGCWSRIASPRAAEATRLVHRNPHDDLLTEIRCKLRHRPRDTCFKR
jgi:hypothetical protein